VPRKGDETIYVSNVAGGYRFFCVVCGKDEVVAIPPTGMPIPVFVTWSKEIEKRHVSCRGKTPAFTPDGGALPGSLL